MKKMYGIIGSGTASAKAIHASLNDLEEDAVFYVAAHKSVGMEIVYDWLIDNEKDFILYGSPSKVLTKHASDVVEINDEANKDLIVLKYLSEGATVLVLWDDGIEESVVKAHQKGYQILELTNGLSPISVEGEEPEVDESTPLTRHELESMPVAAVKRYADNYGLDIRGLGKEEIIDALFPPIQPLLPVPVSVPIDAVGDTISSIIVVFSNGCTLSLNGDADTLHRMVSVIA